MASNNQRAPSAPPPTRWSNESKKNSKENQKLILGQVKEMFESILEPDIILSVVQNCKWKLQPSIDALIMLSESADTPLNRSIHVGPKLVGGSTLSSGRISASLSREGENSPGDSYPDKREYKSNLDQAPVSGQRNSYLNLNDKELLRQQEEFRKFEQLKKDLAEKGFVPSENENLSKEDGEKISRQKLQSWGKTEPAKSYFLSDVENGATDNRLWNAGEKRAKETNSQMDNLFGSKLQFSRDLPGDKTANKGTIPKNFRTQAITDPAIITARNSEPKGGSGSDESGPHDPSQHQQVAQFDSNYDNETKMRAGSGKSNLHKGETESLCGLKVQYRLPGLENSSDDDADVVIEEESADYPTQIPSLMSTNVCQFISTSSQSPKVIRRESSPDSPRVSPQHNTYDDKMKSITAQIVEGYKVLVILRGLPGSGKSHLGNSIVKSTVGGDRSQFVFSTDDYFVMLGRGAYQYVRSKLTDAHNYNQKRVLSALREGVSPVIVDNTNTQSWEMQPYVVMGVQNGYVVEILEPSTPWCRNVNELARKNSHGVPKDTIRDMADRYEPNITGQKLIELFSLRYSPGNFPPQFRKLPVLRRDETRKSEKARQNVGKNRNRRRKRNNGENHLLSDSDKNIRLGDLGAEKNDNNSLQNIVSNALMAENDTLNKSLVDYCIETDSGDEIDSDTVPPPVENGLGDRGREESGNQHSSSSGGEEKTVSESSSSEPPQPPSSSSSSSSSSTSMRKSSGNHQNLGAIGSERKGSVTNLDSESLEKADSNTQENVLSQCWDFTLLFNGRQIHSTYPKLNKSPDFEEAKKEAPEPKSSVIITEIIGDEDKTDPEDVINNIINKMDALEQEAKPNEGEPKAGESAGAFGSIFNMIKKSFLGANSEPEIRSEENIMKYKRQTNDNSLSEIDAFENEKAHREPSSFVILGDEELAAVTIVGDSLSPKLKTQSEGESGDSCRVSEPVTFDTLGVNEGREFLVDDDLSGKLAEERVGEVGEGRNETENLCAYSSIDSDPIVAKPEEDGDDVSEIDCDIDNDEPPTDSVYDILTQAVNRIISRQETEAKGHSDDDESESSMTESSGLISGPMARNEEAEKFPTEEQEIDREKDSRLLGTEGSKSPGISHTESSRPEEKTDEEGPEIIDNINQVTWKESPFPVPAQSISALLERSRKPDVVSKSDSATNTSNYDFNVLYVGGTSEPEYRVLRTTSRTINSCLNLADSEPEKPPLKLMLDKSSMTSVVDILSGEESLEFRTELETIKDLEDLVEMFPNVPREDIDEIYKGLCSCNFGWAVDMLLDGVPEQVTKYGKIEGPKIPLADSGEAESQNSTPRRERMEKLKQSSSSESNDGEGRLQPQNSSPRKKKERNKVSEESLELKRQIEEKMVMNEASYNPHILRVKRWKNGEPDINPEAKDERISTPQRIEEFEEFGEDDQSPKSSESNDDFTEDDIEPEEMMELNLGEDFIKVLENQFGNPEFQMPGGLFPVIQIKKSMAQRIHALWMESMEIQLNAQQEQLDRMIEKDAEYARSLEQEEARSMSEPLVPNLPEIMDMEMALAIYHNDLKKQIELETPNDMASRLTRQMLHDMFTDYDPETLDEILKAHNGNFKETVDVLEASTGRVVNRNNSTLKKQKSLIDRAKKESMQSNEEAPDSGWATVVVNPELGQLNNPNATLLTYETALKEAQFSRKEAHRQLLLRNENFEKAKEAIRKGNREVAGYYSQMAKLHAKKREWANSTAASAFLAAQDYKMNTENTLDLHFLYVAEALQALDVFLDYQISRLSEGSKKSISFYIITGRGARSSRGMSRIKPAVSKRLASKNIRFMDENPGCLKVVIHRRNIPLG